MASFMIISELSNLVRTLEAEGADPIEIAAAREARSAALRAFTAAPQAPVASPQIYEEFFEEPAAAEAPAEAAAPAAPEEAPAASAAAPKRYNTGANFHNDDFQRMCRDHTLVPGLRFFARRHDDRYEFTLKTNLIAGGATEGFFYSDPNPEANWIGGIWRSPAGPSKASAAHITPSHPRETNAGNGWKWLRVGSQTGPFIQDIREIWKRDPAAARTRLRELFPELYPVAQ